MPEKEKMLAVFQGGISLSPTNAAPDSQSPNKAPEPTTMAVTPRAIE
jgi:hypothetical protein